MDVRVDLENETVWLTQEEISFLFEKSVAVISRHITNIFKDGVLEKNFFAKNAKKSQCK